MSKPKNPRFAAIADEVDPAPPPKPLAPVRAPDGLPALLFEGRLHQMIRRERKAGMQKETFVGNDGNDVVTITIERDSRNAFRDIYTAGGGYAGRTKL